MQTFNEDGRATFLLPWGGPEDHAETGDTRVGWANGRAPREAPEGPLAPE